MMTFEITFAPGTPDEQSQAMLAEMEEYADFMRASWQASATSLATGAAIVTLAFGAKAFFEAFLKELGKDSYVWLKAKLGFEKAQQIGKFNVEYCVTVQGMFFHDNRSEASDVRHATVLFVVRSVCERIERDGIEKVKRVRLVFDPRKEAYVTAMLYSSTSQQFKNGKPIDKPIVTLEL